MRPSAQLCSRFHIRYPIFQAPIGGIASPELAAAVSNAGGVGHLACTWDSPENVRSRIEKVRDLTEAPFGVNFVLDFPIEDNLLMALDSGVPIISFFWGVSEKYIALVRESGALAVQVVASVAEAVRAVQAGADAIVAQGHEAGGHVRGQVSTMVLVPRVVDRVGDVPVLAAGGIADRRGVAASLALGAAGVWVGTRFLAAEEANIHPRYRECVIAATEEESVYSSLFDIGWPKAAARTLSNTTMRQWEQVGKPDTLHRPREWEVVGNRPNGTDILCYDSDAPTRNTVGDAEAMALYAGQAVGMVHAVLPASQIMHELAAGVPV